jgi:hypothetical protein
MNPEGYDPSGWYPGKKRKNPILSGALQGLTMGIYNPDNRTSSRVNKMIAEGRIQTRQQLDEAKGREQVKMESDDARLAAAQERLRTQLVKMGKSPEEADTLIAAAYGQPQMEAIAKSRAGEQGAKADELKNIGRQVGASEAGMRDTAAEAAQSKLAAEAGETGVQEMVEQRRAGLPASKADATAAKLRNEKMLSQIGAKGMAESDMISDATAGDRATAAQNTARSAAISSGAGVKQATTADTLAGAQTRLLDDPKKAEALAAAQLEDKLQTTLPPNTIVEGPLSGQRTGMEQVISSEQTGVDDFGNPVMKPVITYRKPGEAAAQPVGGAPSPVSEGAAKKMKKVGNAWVPVN